MAREVEQAEDGADRNDESQVGGVATERVDGRFRIGLALAKRGLDVAALAEAELSELEAVAWERLSPVLDAIVERWQDDHGQFSEQEKIDRELRRQMTSEKAAIVDHYSDFECEGCNYHYYDHCAFTDFHGLFLCDGCVREAREILRDLQRPLIEALEAEPTLEHARALGFELLRQDGRLIWVSDDDDYDGGSYPYANEQEAVEGLVGELT